MPGSVPVQREARLGSVPCLPTLVIAIRFRSATQAHLHSGLSAPRASAESSAGPGAEDSILRFNYRFKRQLICLFNSELSRRFIQRITRLIVSRLTCRFVCRFKLRLSLRMNCMMNLAFIPQFNCCMNRRISHRFNCRSIRGFDCQFNRGYTLEVNQGVNGGVTLGMQCSGTGANKPRAC